IERAPLLITAEDKSRAYGQANPELTASYGGFVNGETAAGLDAPVSLSTTATASSPVGGYPIVASGAADANYAISFVEGALTIGQASLLITAENKSKVYGQANPALSASYSGFVNGETAADLDTPVSLSTTASASSPVGGYPITASEAADANYAISFVEGALTIGRASLLITAENKSK